MNAFTIVSHAVAALLGAGGVFVYLHKHSSAATTLATSMSADLASAKAELAKIKADVGAAAAPAKPAS
jgi:hypothetical protein